MSSICHSSKPQSWFGSAAERWCAANDLNSLGPRCVTALSELVETQGVRRTKPSAMFLSLEDHGFCFVRELNEWSKEVKKPIPTKPALKKAIVKEVKTVEVTPAKEVTTVECRKPVKVTHVNTSDLPLAVEVETVELETVIVKESDQDLINQKAKELKKEKAT
jgi:hypothetical protein